MLNDSTRPNPIARLRPSGDMAVLCTGLAVLLVVGVAYYPLLTAGFVDRYDRHYLSEVGRIRQTTWSEATAALQRFHLPPGAAPTYQPLTAWSLMVDAALVQDWMAAAFHFHLGNLVLHLLNVLLVLGLARSLSCSLLWAALAALLFGLHPVQVESVAWIAQRQTLLGTFFVLLTILCHMRFGRSGRWRWFVLITPFFAAALLSKPAFLGLPVALLALDVWPLRRSGWRPVLEKLPLVAVALACAALHHRLRGQVEPIQTPDLHGVALLAANLGSFARRLVWPVGLSPFYPPQAPPGGLVVGVPLLIAPFAATVAALRYCRPVFTGLAGALVMVIPALYYAPLGNQLLGDQYLYPALILPLAAAAAWVGEKGNILRLPSGRCAAVAVGGLVLMVGVLANVQTYVWHSSKNLFTHMIALHPHWSRGYLGLVEALILEGDLDAALHYARKGVAVAPADPSSKFYLGRVLVLHHDGRSAEAIEPLRQALASNTKWVDCLHNLGIALVDVGRVDEAIGYLEQARDLRPRSAPIRLTLGTAYLLADRPASARAEFQEALYYENEPMAHFGLAQAWAGNNQPELARRHLAVAVAHDSRYAALAARFPELRRLSGLPGFEGLIDETAPAPDLQRPGRITPTRPRG